ncbi:hypothetical protein BHE74_00051933 [Ensete ventricosum]|nr:hypothetical protein BHE74_00051933 [Ensete ventricosum]
MALRLQSVSPLPELCISASPSVLCPSCVSRPVPQFFARVAYLGQPTSLLPESCISASPLVLCLSRISRPVPQFFARVAYLGQSLSSLPELRISTSPPVCCPSCVSRPVPQFFARVAYLGQSTSSFARVAYLGQSINPLLLNLGQSFARTVLLIHLSLPYGPEATRARGHPLDSRSASARPLSGGKE